MRISFRPVLLLVTVLVAIGAGVWIGDRFHRNDDGTVAPTPLADDSLVLDAPLPEATVHSPLVIRGRARGTWFFEGVFPIMLTDWDGRIIGQTQAHAQGEWATPDFVDFEAKMEFTPDTTVSSRGALILKKDNPSDLPENDDSREITVFFE